MYDNRERQPVPLTGGQKGQLLLQQVLPLIVFLALAAYYLTVLGDSIGSLSPLFWLIYALILLYLAYRALKGVRDLFSGVALVSRDVLEYSHRTPQSWFTFRGQFAQIGRVTLMRPAYDKAQAGRAYWVYYSPASKVVWNAEPAD